MKEDKNIEKLIRDSLKFEESPENFADKVMQRIEAADQVEEKALSSLLNRYTLEHPSARFTQKVMARIGTVSSVETNPVIIGRKAWAVILSVLAILIGYSLLAKGGSETEPGPYAGLLDRIGDFFGQLDGSLSVQLPELFTNPVFAISLFALTSLLLLDQMIKGRRFSTI